MPAEKKNNLALNFFSLGFVQLINSSLQLLVIPYVISIIGADGFGVVAVAQVVMIFLSTFSEYGFNQTATRNVALYRDDRDSISKNFSTVFFTKIFLCLFSFLLLLILVLVVPLFRTHLLLYLMAFVFVLGQSFLVNWFFQGMEKMWFIVLTTLAGRILFVVLVFLFIKNKEDDFLFLFFMGVGNILSVVAGTWIACRVFKITIKRTGLGAIRNELKEGWHYTVTNLSMNTCQYANVFILRLFTNDLVAGYFSIAERIFFVAKQVLVIFSQSIYPRVCRVVVSGKKELISFLQKSYVPFLICVMAGSIVLFILSPRVLYFFSADEAVHSVYILRMLCIVLVIVCLNIPFTLVLLATERKKAYFRIFTLGGVLNIVSNIILAGLFQTNGTIAAIFITEVFITAGVIYESRPIRLT